MVWMIHSEDHDQLASSEASCPGSSVFKSWYTIFEKALHTINSLGWIMVLAFPMNIHVLAIIKTVCLSGHIAQSVRFQFWLQTSLDVSHIEML